MAARQAFTRQAADLSRVLGDRLIAFVAYGPASSAAFTKTITADDLDALGSLAGGWRHDGLAAPLLVTPGEFRRSLDAFPLEYQAMMDHHVVITGESPFGGIAVNPDDLRRACEEHARSHLIHLRQGWIEAGGHEAHTAELLAHSAAPLRALLESVAKLTGAKGETADDLTRFANQTIGMPAELVGAVLSLEHRPADAHRLVHRLAEYLTATERLWAFVDEWRR